MPREKLNLAAAMGIVVVLTVSIGMVGAWAATHYERPATHLAGGVLRASPSPSPSPTPAEPPPPLPSTVQVVAPSPNFVWALKDYQALFVSADQGKTWDERTLPMPPGGIRPLISFINEREGWLLAPGVPATQCEEATARLWHTADGAASWQPLNVSGIDKSQCKDGIWFVDAKRGFVSASDPNHHPTIYRTIDGGTTWTSAVLPDPPDFKSSAGGFELAAVWIKAFGSTLYLEASDNQTDPATSHQYIFTSSDGAAWSWRQKVPPRAPVMVTETRLLLLTGPGEPQESTNGGQQWHPYQTDFRPDSTEFRGATIVFADDQVGYETGSGLLQRTDDGGGHWDRIPSPGTSPSLPAPSPIAMPSSANLSAPSSKVVWAVVAGQSLFRSTDQGATWQARSLPFGPGTDNPLISFTDGLTGYLMYRSTSVSDCSLQGATLWNTTDGGDHWQSANGMPTGECKDAMYFTDEQHGLLSTGDAFNVATIWRTADGGRTWVKAVNDAKRPAPRIWSFQAYGSTVLAYAPPFVYRSTDGGQTWSYVTQSPKSSKSIGFVTASRWIELISPSESSETTDAGASWHTLNTNYSQAAPIAPQIVFADAHAGYATVRGEVQRTLDGGAHWEMIKTSWP